jgi:hypothetical protein
MMKSNKAGWIPLPRVNKFKPLPRESPQTKEERQDAIRKQVS